MTPPPPRQGRRTWLSLLGVLAVLVTAVVVGGYLHDRDRPPFGYDELSASLVQTEVVPGAQAQSRLDALLRPGTLHPTYGAHRVLIGELGYTVPADVAPDDGHLSLLVTDRRTGATFGRPSGAGPRPEDATGGGWDGSFEVLSSRYSWLRGTASRRVDGSYENDSTALNVPYAGPFVFAVDLPDGLSSDDIDVTLLLSSHDRVAWVHRFASA